MLIFLVLFINLFLSKSKKCLNYVGGSETLCYSCEFPEYTDRESLTEPFFLQECQSKNSTFINKIYLVRAKSTEESNCVECKTKNVEIFYNLTDALSSASILAKNYIDSELHIYMERSEENFFLYENF